LILSSTNHSFPPPPPPHPPHLPPFRPPGPFSLPRSRNSSSIKADWIRRRNRRRRRLLSAMKHEIAGEWNGNETNVIAASDTRRARMNARATAMPMAGGAPARLIMRYRACEARANYLPSGARNAAKRGKITRPRQLSWRSNVQDRGRGVKRCNLFYRINRGIKKPHRQSRLETRITALSRSRRPASAASRLTNRGAGGGESLKCPGPPIPKSPWKPSFQFRSCR